MCHNNANCTMYIVHLLQRIPFCVQTNTFYENTENLLSTYSRRAPSGRSTMWTPHHALMNEFHLAYYPQTITATAFNSRAIRISLSTGMHRYSFYWFDVLQGTPKVHGYYRWISNNERAIWSFHSSQFCFKRSGQSHMKLLRADFGSIFFFHIFDGGCVRLSLHVCVIKHSMRQRERDECINRSTSETAGLPVVLYGNKKNERKGRKRVKEHPIYL